MAGPIVREERIGDCRLIQGDCLEVLPLLDKVDAVITSPPYGQQRDYGKKITDWRALVSGALLKTPAHEATQILCNLGLIHRDGSVVRYWDDLISDMEANNWRLFGWYVWDQGDGLPGNWNGRLAPSHEWVFHFNRAARTVNKWVKPKKQRAASGTALRKANGETSKVSSPHLYVQATKIQDSVIRVYRQMDRSGPEVEHPAVFPVQLPNELMQSFTDVGQTILDPFMGSGTTLVACAKLGRKGIGIELDPDYFDIACRRVEEAYRQPDLFIEPPTPPTQESMDL